MRALGRLPALFTTLKRNWLVWTWPFRWFGLRLYRDVRWWVSIFVTAVQRFDQHDSEMRAAAIAYYALISLFPLILLLIVGVSYVLETEAAQARVLELVGTYIPTSIDVVRESIRQIVGARGAISAVALITFIWSAMAVFSTIERAMNRIWDVTVLRPYWRGKLMALLGIIGIGTLTVLSVSTTAAVTYVKDVILPFVASHTEVDVGPWEVLVVLLPYLTSVLLFMLAYRIFPYTQPGLAGCVAGWPAGRPGLGTGETAVRPLPDGFQPHELRLRFGRGDYRHAHLVLLDGHDLADWRGNQFCLYPQATSHSIPAVGRDHSCGRTTPHQTLRSESLVRCCPGVRFSLR